MNPNSSIALICDVNKFLTELNEVLTSENCELDILPRKKDENPTDPFTTQNTLLSLNFTSDDIKSELQALTAKEYIETITDNKGQNHPPFWVFGKAIQNREVYIKVKIRNRKTNKVFCVSFHFARHPFKTMPY